ncbi:MULTISPECIES: respiratory nitrate reductase subunit gamma [unclassified Pseudoalteromonas]|uniref:respiratory nitrate reductase subunit gamma n=1 Tax=unclassified Pseudoalteromonas TaxID=194690 RepID=UPI000C3806DF|nr:MULTISPECIES: respiratory nitrate reductase subunit gamma [unclassified Pseudoalteromonas]MAB62034.1 respiratory nitrate reductase subunit gamma [Pseudoalteromonas sp.]MCH2087053.1 respiratory nitrate reductase subunit gamma [Pseudoalteromonas sp.]NHH88819.1 Respiratory nitrate reductase 1 gamma chain [Pseudoalteromonas sp. MB47]NRA80084.1 respiratory nitrate reductase subunit gamma [Pseudoalteromonas sp.]
MSYLNTLLFGIYPYITLAVFIIASIIRYDREQYTWKTGSSQLLESKELKRGSRAFHIGVIMVLLGHFVGLLTPAEVWHVVGIEASHKQLIAMGLGGVFGLLCFYGLTILIKRRLTNPRIRATSSKMDIAVLLLLYVQLILGLLSIFVSAGHLDGAEMLLLMSWAQNIVTLDGAEAAAAIAQVHWIYKLHVFLGMSLFLVFPFSRLVHIASVPIQYLSRSYQVVRSKS